MADTVTQKSPKPADKSKPFNVIHRMTSETLRLAETDLASNNANLLPATSNAQRKKPCSFQITSVIVGRINNDGGDDSADDLDESHADDIDCSRVTDNETPSYSEDTYSKEDVFFNVSSSSMCSAPVIPTSSQYGLAIVPPSTGTSVSTITTVPVNANDANLSVVDASSCAVDASTSSKPHEPDAKDMQNIPSRNDRFKVVKIESTEPFKRGRWSCMDYLDQNIQQVKSDNLAFANQYVSDTMSDNREVVGTSQQSASLQQQQQQLPPGAGVMSSVPASMSAMPQSAVGQMNQQAAYFPAGVQPQVQQQQQQAQAPQPQQQQSQTQSQGGQPQYAQSAGAPVQQQQQRTQSHPPQQYQQGQMGLPPQQQQQQLGQVPTSTGYPPMGQGQMQQQPQGPAQAQQQQQQPQQAPQQQQPPPQQQQAPQQQQQLQQQQGQQPNVVPQGMLPPQQQMGMVHQPGASSGVHQVYTPSGQVYTTAPPQQQQAPPQQQTPQQQYVPQGAGNVAAPQNQFTPASSHNIMQQQQPQQQQGQIYMSHAPAMVPQGQSYSGQPTQMISGNLPAQGQSYAGQMSLPQAPNYQTSGGGQSGPGSIATPPTQATQAYTQSLLQSQGYVGAPQQQQIQMCNQNFVGQAPTQGSYTPAPQQPQQQQAPQQQQQPAQQQQAPQQQPMYTQNVPSSLPQSNYRVTVPSSPASIQQQPLYAAPTTVTQHNQFGSYAQPQNFSNNVPQTVQYMALQSMPNMYTTQTFNNEGPSPSETQVINEMPPDTPVNTEDAEDETAHATDGLAIALSSCGSGKLNIDDQQVEAAHSRSVTPPQSHDAQNQSATGNSAVAIDNKIEQAMDLVKSHLMFAVREEVEVLKEKIAELMDRINQLETENSILKASATQETLAQLNVPVSTTSTHLSQAPAQTNMSPGSGAGSS